MRDFCLTDSSTGPRLISFVFSLYTYSLEHTDMARADPEIVRRRMMGSESRARGAGEIASPEG